VSNSALNGFFHRKRIGPYSLTSRRPGFIGSQTLCASLNNLVRTLASLLVLLICACSTNIHSVRPSSDLDQIEPELKSILPTGWSVARNGNVFQLRGSNKLWVYSPVQRDVGLTLDQWVKKTGSEIIYTITLRFEPLMPKEQYEQLKRERAPYEKIVNEGGGTINEWERAVGEFNRLKVPVYFTDRYSVYAEKPDIFPDRVYPESGASDCKQVVGSLDKLFNRYEPLSNKNSDFQVRT
jgi:hypothetical protein